MSKILNKRTINSLGDKVRKVFFPDYMLDLSDREGAVYFLSLCLSTPLSLWVSVRVLWVPESDVLLLIVCGGFLLQAVVLFFIIALPIRFALSLAWKIIARFALGVSMWYDALPDEPYGDKKKKKRVLEDFSSDEEEEPVRLAALLDRHR